MPSDDKVQQYCDYLSENYIFSFSLFPPKLWSSNDTTNSCESFHSRFNMYYYIVYTIRTAMRTMKLYKKKVYYNSMMYNSSVYLICIPKNYDLMIYMLNMTPDALFLYIIITNKYIYY